MWPSSIRQQFSSNVASPIRRCGRHTLGDWGHLARRVIANVAHNRNRLPCSHCRLAAGWRSWRVRQRDRRHSRRRSSRLGIARWDGDGTPFAADLSHQEQIFHGQHCRSRDGTHSATGKGATFVKHGMSRRTASCGRSAGGRRIDLSDNRISGTVLMWRLRDGLDNRSVV